MAPIGACLGVLKPTEPKWFQSLYVNDQIEGEVEKSAIGEMERLVAEKQNIQKSSMLIRQAVSILFFTLTWIFKTRWLLHPFF